MLKLFKRKRNKGSDPYGDIDPVFGQCQELLDIIYELDKSGVNKLKDAIDSGFEFCKKVRAIKPEEGVDVDFMIPKKEKKI